MADKPIGALPTAENIADDDNFVLEQNSTAKRLTGKTLVSFLLNRLNGRGGIKSIVKVTSTGLVDLYDINYTDGTSQRITITNGRGITGIDKVSTNGNADTYAIRYNDGTSTQFTVLNGTNGKDGEDAYVWVRYASLQPSNANPSFGEVPDRWMGVYSGPDATAPKEWSAYKWYDTKGERGLSIYRVNGINRPLYRYSYNDLILPVDHTPKVGDLVITTDGYLASVTQVFADTEQVDVESTDIRLGGDSYVELLYGDDGLTVFDAVNSGRPVYLLYEDYHLPMVTWTTDVLSATFGGCFDNKIITCKFESAVWSANVKTIEGATDETGEDNVVIVTESTTQAELSAAYNAGKVIVLKRYQAGGYKLYYHAGNWRFFRVADGVIEEAVYNAGTWTYNTVESVGGAGDIFVGDADTTVAEYYAAFTSGKACFMIRPYGGTGNTMWTAYTCGQSIAQFYRITGSGAIQYGMLNSDGTFNYTTLGRTDTIDEKSTDEQIPTAKAVYEVVKNSVPDSSGLTSTEKSLILTLFRNAAYTSADMNGILTQLEALWSGSGGETGKTLTSISATYSGGNVAAGTAVTDLTGIVVTAHYSDGTSAVVTGYILSGTISEGSNTITVSYGGKTTTFTVTGVAESGGDSAHTNTIFPLADGTKTFSGATVEIASNHVKIKGEVGGMNNLSAYVNLTNVETNTDDKMSVDNVDTANAYPMIGGKKYNLTISNFSQDTANYYKKLGIRGSDGTDIWATEKFNGNATFTVTPAEDCTATCIYFGGGLQSGSTLELDLTFEEAAE